MKTVLKFDTANALALPTEFQNDDVRFSDSFAEHFIEHYSKPVDHKRPAFTPIGNFANIGISI